MTRAAGYALPLCAAALAGCAQHSQANEDGRDMGYATVAEYGTSDLGSRFGGLGSSGTKAAH